MYAITSSYCSKLFERSFPSMDPKRKQRNLNLHYSPTTIQHIVHPPNNQNKNLWQSCTQYVRQAFKLRKE